MEGCRKAVLYLGSDFSVGVVPSPIYPIYNCSLLPMV